nr:MAG: hypothetical protein [Hangzhou tombus-like virus 2]
MVYTFGGGRRIAGEGLVAAPSGLSPLPALKRVERGVKGTRNAWRRVLRACRQVHTPRVAMLRVSLRRCTFGAIIARHQPYPPKRLHATWYLRLPATQCLLKPRHPLHHLSKPQSTNVLRVDSPLRALNPDEAPQRSPQIQHVSLVPSKGGLALGPSGEDPVLPWLIAHVSHASLMDTTPG